MSGLMDLLTNPLVETLLPTALGATGGLLATPPMSGRKVAIGNALQGGAAGLTGGLGLAQRQKLDAAQMAEIQQHTANLKLDAKKLQGSIDDQTQYDQQVQELAGKITDPNDKAQFLALSKVDPKGAFAHYAQANPVSKKIDAGAINRVFGGPGSGITEEQIMAMPPEARAPYLEAALKIETQNKAGQQIPTESGIYWAMPNPKDPSHPTVTPIVDPNTGKPLIPLKMTIANMSSGDRRYGIDTRSADSRYGVDTRADTATAGIESREGTAEENRRMQSERAAFGAYQKEEKMVSDKQKDWDKNYAILDDESRKSLNAPPRPEDLAPWDDVKGKYMAAYNSAAPAAAAPSAATAPATGAPSAPTTAPAKGAPPTSGTPPKEGEHKDSGKTKEPPPALTLPGVGAVKFLGKMDEKGRAEYAAPDGKVYWVDPKRIPAEAIPKG